MLAITFVLSLIAILIGILAYRRGRALNRRLDEMNRSFFPNMVRQKDAIERIDKRIQGIAIRPSPPHAGASPNWPPGS